MGEMDRYLPPLTPTAKHWVRSIGVFVAVVLLLWAAYYLRPVLTPLIVALAIAYVLDPVVDWLERRNARRLLIVIVLYAILSIILTTLGVIVALKVFGQIIDFEANFERYLETVASWIRRIPGVDWGAPAAIGVTETVAATQPVVGPTSAPASAPAARWLDNVTPILRDHGLGMLSSTVAFVQSLFTNVTNLLSVLVLIPMYSFFFLWRFDDMVATVRDHLPARYRETIVYFVTTIDRAIASFFRGRLIVCTIIGLVNAIGWHFVGVRNGLLLGFLSGALSLVPFMSFLAVPPAVFFRYVTAVEAGQPWVTPVVLTFGVYLFTQALESFLLSPQIEGKAAGLHPITTIVALLIGAQVAGVLGMLLSIPLASTVKTFSVEFLLPKIRKLAEEQPDIDPQLGDEEVIPATPTPKPVPVDPPDPKKPKK